MLPFFASRFFILPDIVDTWVSIGEYGENLLWLPCDPETITARGVSIKRPRRIRRPATFDAPLDPEALRMFVRIRAVAIADALQNHEGTWVIGLRLGKQRQDSVSLSLYGAKLTQPLQDDLPPLDEAPFFGNHGTTVEQVLGIDGNRWERLLDDDSV